MAAPNPESPGSEGGLEHPPLASASPSSGASSGSDPLAAQAYGGPAADQADALAMDDSLVHDLAAASHEFDDSGADPERNCWLAVHRHLHGVLPSEYDIREIDEDLYLAVLARRRAGEIGRAHV